MPHRWASDDHCLVNLIVILLQITAGYERTHTVSKQNIWHISDTLLDQFSHLMRVLYQTIVSGIIEISKIRITHDAAAMSAMIMDHTQISLLCQKFHKIIISLLVFTHSMQYLYYANNLSFRRNRHRMDFKLVCM